MHQYRYVHQPEKKRKRLTFGESPIKQVNQRRQEQTSPVKIVKMKLRSHSEQRFVISDSYSEHAIQPISKLS